jgi:hypothetical protein
MEINLLFFKKEGNWLKFTYVEIDLSTPRARGSKFSKFVRQKYMYRISGISGRHFNIKATLNICVSESLRLKQNVKRHTILHSF